MTSKWTLTALEKFSPETMTKIDLFESARLLLGLNCLELGQSQRIHAHPEADKFYYVLSGRAEFIVGNDIVEASAGDLVLCPAGQPHGIENVIERTTVLVGIAPWHTRAK